MIQFIFVPRSSPAVSRIRRNIRKISIASRALINFYDLRSALRVSASRNRFSYARRARLAEISMKKKNKRKKKNRKKRNSVAGLLLLFAVKTRDKYRETLNITLVALSSLREARFFVEQIRKREIAARWRLSRDGVLCYSDINSRRWCCAPTPFVGCNNGSYLLSGCSA